MDEAEFNRRVADCENALKRFMYFKMPSNADGDDVLQETLGTHILENYIKAKRIEWDGYKKAVHPWEIEKYLKIY